MPGCKLEVWDKGDGQEQVLFFLGRKNSAMDGTGLDRNNINDRVISSNSLFKAAKEEKKSANAGNLRDNKDRCSSDCFE